MQISFTIKWYQIAVGVILIFLIFMVFRSCKPEPDHSSEKKQVDSLDLVIENSNKIRKSIIDSLTRQDSILSKDNQFLQSLVVEKQSQVNDAEKKAKILADKIIAEGHQAPAYFANCDSLAIIVKGDSLIIKGYEILSDSLIDAQKKEVVLKQGIINHLDTMFTQSNNALFDVSRKYGNLYVDYTKSTKNLKFNKTFGRITAAGLVLALAYIFIHK